MSFREKLEAEVAELAVSHETNRAKYRELLAQRDEINAAVRAACDLASASANELGAARKALEELDRNAPKPIEASGAIQA